MKCNASPTISIDPKPQPDARAVATATVSAVLFRSILAPLAAGLGPVGDVVVDAVADSAFVQRAR
jgi:hypothetical protein